MTIRGHGFGQTGRVYFPPPDPRDPAFALGGGDVAILGGVSAKRWTDTEIDVIVPAWATAGELHLNAFTLHRDPCARIEVYRLGNSILFDGGLAAVFSVYIADVEVDFDSKELRNLRPGENVMLGWRATARSSVKIDIELRDGSRLLWSKNGLPGGFGYTVLPVPDPEPKQPRTASLVFTAHSNCGALKPLIVPVYLSVRPRLDITYLEVTQGVQGTLHDVVAGKAIPAIALKDTAVRVHMSCDRGGWYENRLDRITGCSWSTDGC